MSNTCCLDETCGSKSLTKVYEEDVKITKKFNRNKIITYAHRTPDKQKTTIIVVHFGYLNGNVTATFNMSKNWHNRDWKEWSNKALWFSSGGRTIKQITEEIDATCTRLVAKDISTDRMSKDISYLSSYSEHMKW